MQTTPLDFAPLEGPRFEALLYEFLIDAFASAIANFETLARATLFAATARACGPFEAPSSRAHRPISVNALSASLRRPFETTRRNANALIAEGLLARTPDGVHVPFRALADPRVGAFGDRCHDLLVRLVEDLHAVHMSLPLTRAPAAYDPRITIGIAFDLLLGAFEYRDGDDRNLMRVALMCAIGWSHDRFGRGYGRSAAPPPARPATIARMLGIPYATVARNIDQLVREGALTRMADGLIITPERRESVAIVAAQSAYSNRARQLLGRLPLTGFPVDRPASAYIQGRPPSPLGG